MGALEIKTPRLRLRPWCDSDADTFAALNADPIVMEDLGGPLTRAESDQKLVRFSHAFAENSYGRFVIESLNGTFLGYAGIMLSKPDHVLGQHNEIGWRLHQKA